MTSTPDTTDRLDIIAIGNAIVDVMAPATDEFLAREELLKGGMQLIDAIGARALYGKMGSAREMSGGSAATCAATPHTPRSARPQGCPR